MASPEIQPQSPGFAVVVHEKGGTERREVFRSAELSIGRVQGNDLMLPKGNVSKKHARLLLRDGRFIVTDLNSTNGTYVNRRRIAQATIVREGDRIYIGDFVLRVEPPAGAEGAGGADPTLSSLDRDRQSGASVRPGSGRPTAEFSGHPAGMFPDVTPGRIPTENSAPSAHVADNEPSRPSAPIAGRGSPEPPTGSLRRQALSVLMGRMHEVLAPGALDKDVDDHLTLRIEELLGRQLEELSQDGAFDDEVSQIDLVNDARAELLQYGAVTHLLDSEDVTEIVVARFDDATALRAGQRERVEPAFSSEASLRRTITRLCRLAGQVEGPGETVIRRHLPGDWTFWAVTGEGAPRGASVVFRRSAAVLSTLDRLVDDAVITLRAAQFLEQCVWNRNSVLVVGSRSAGAPAVFGALGSVDMTGLIIALHGMDCYLPERSGVIRWDPSAAVDGAADLARAAAAVDRARLVAELGSPEALGCLIRLALAGVEGVLAYAPLSGIRHALATLPALAANGSVGATASALAQMVLGCFDVLVEVKSPGGQPRVSRICEVVGDDGGELRLRDVFKMREPTDGPARSGELEPAGEPGEFRNALRTGPISHEPDEPA